MLQIYNLLIKGILESVDRIVNTVGGGYYYFSTDITIMLLLYFS